MPRQPTLSSLPVAILVRVCGDLGPSDFVRVRCGSRALSRLLADAAAAHVLERQLLKRCTLQLIDVRTTPSLSPSPCRVAKLYSSGDAGAIFRCWTKVFEIVEYEGYRAAPVMWSFLGVRGGPEITREGGSSSLKAVVVASSDPLVALLALFIAEPQSGLLVVGTTDQAYRVDVPFFSHLVGGQCVFVPSTDAAGTLIGVLSAACIRELPDGRAAIVTAKKLFQRC